MKYLLVVGLLMCIVCSASAGDYIIGDGDGLEIAVWGVKELNVPAKVRPDGKITVPGLGDVVASGLTPQELQKVLADRLKDLIKSPIVTVTVKEVTNSKVYVFGGGVKSGTYDISRRTTLLQLLCTVGEMKSADLKRSYLLRSGKILKSDFHNLFINGDIKEDISLETGDSLFMPILQDKSVYVLGAVNLPKSIEYRDGMTVMEAILEAGGFTKFADQDDVSIRRKDGEKETSFDVKLKKLIKNGELKQNVKLKVGDYVVVKESIF
jgi:polysaccharide export outer membrane protein